MYYYLTRTCHILEGVDRTSIIPIPYTTLHITSMSLAIPFRGIKISVQLSRTFLNNTCFAYYTKTYENSRTSSIYFILLTFFHSSILLPFVCFNSKRCITFFLLNLLWAFIPMTLTHEILHVETLNLY